MDRQRKQRNALSYEGAESETEGQTEEQTGRLTDKLKDKQKEETYEGGQRVQQK
jgi:hypothetical protein